MYEMLKLEAIIGLGLGFETLWP